MLDELFLKSREYLKNSDAKYVRYFLKRHQLSSKMVIIIGSRGVGKTTAIMQHILKNYPPTTNKALYVSADSFFSMEYSLYEIAKSLYDHEGELLSIDEIHKYQNWSGELKSIYDSFPKLKVIASGSSALEISKGSHDLSRRALVYHFLHLSFREFLEFELGLEFDSYELETIVSTHQEIALEITKQIEAKDRKVLKLFKEYLEYGYFPYYKSLSLQEYKMTLEQQINTTIEGDLLSLYPSINGLSIMRIKKLVSIIAKSVPMSLDITYLKKSLEITDDRTLKNYLYQLEKANIIRLLSKTPKGLSSLEKPEKIYLNNPNLMYLYRPDIGSIRETFFISSLDNLKTAPLLSKHGDFLVDEKYSFEIGGKGKDFSQVKDIKNSYLALDEMEVGIGNKIPLWLFGFLY